MNVFDIHTSIRTAPVTFHLSIKKQTYTYIYICKWNVETYFYILHTYTHMLILMSFLGMPPKGLEAMPLQ